MMRINSLHHRQQGFILNAEFMLFVAVLVLGLVVGWVTLRDSFNAELLDTANAIEKSITFYYFNDPDRGESTSGFSNDTLNFVAPSDNETTRFQIDPDSTVMTPFDGISTGSLNISSTGSITSGLAGSEAGGFGATASETGSLTGGLQGSEAGGFGAAPSATGTVEATPGSESDGGTP